MKSFYAPIVLLLISRLCYAGAPARSDTSKNNNHKNPVAAIEMTPEYPGGTSAFGDYIGRKLQYPGAARLIGVNGKVYVSFVIDKDGSVTDVSAVNCIGAGCESEAVRVVQRCKRWRPGVRNGSPVRVNYIIPIYFNMEPSRVYLENLRESDYGFVFSIKGKLYSLDEAEEKLGKSFKPEKIEIAEHYYTTDPKLLKHPKKEVYLLIIKST